MLPGAALRRRVRFYCLRVSARRQVLPVLPLRAFDLGLVPVQFFRLPAFAFGGSRLPVLGLRLRGLRVFAAERFGP